MDENKETIQNFSDMVNATQQLSKPWQEHTKRLTLALILTNLFWAIIVAMFVWFAYMTPVDVNQEQDFDDNIQHQSYSEGVTDSD